MGVLLLLFALVYPLAPFPRVTPGEVRPLSLSVVCSTRWGIDRRKVTQAMKRQVAAAYGVPWESRALYEFDHLVPRSLGGADTARNLWPQRWADKWGAHQKDLLENELHNRVCAGTLPLTVAQTEIRTDWRAAYTRYVPLRLRLRQ